MARKTTTETPDIKAEDKQETPGKFKYPLYDLWRIDASPEGKNDDNQAKVFNVTAIKKTRSNVKIEKHVAESRNKHSHNSLERYYPAGSITNGHEEKINVN